MQTGNQLLQSFFRHSVFLWPNLRATRQKVNRGFPASANPPRGISLILPPQPAAGERPGAKPQ
jgi:hypothetical protein